MLIGAVTLGLGLGAGAASADEVNSDPQTKIECGNPIVLLSPGAHIDGPRCHAVTVVDQESTKNNSDNVPVLSTVFGTQKD
ncbi:hypothetical protein BJF79_17850 [Actinomadura sp. CNU-125]|nr:hypothetical protein BJF79_17850 [Actinomadura sp. CNU-125]